MIDTLEALGFNPKPGCWIKYARGLTLIYYPDNGAVFLTADDGFLLTELPKRYTEHLPLEQLVVALCG